MINLRRPLPTICECIENSIPEALGRAAWNEYACWLGPNELPFALLGETTRHKWMAVGIAVLKAAACTCEGYGDD